MNEIELPITSRSSQQLVWSFGAVEFDEQRWQLTVRGEIVELEPRPLEILAYLLRHAGETVTREELLQEVWGHAYLSKNALSNSISKLRRAIGDDEETQIVTVHRVGYRLAVPATCRPTASEPLSLGLGAGAGVPLRPGWILVGPLGHPPSPDVWLARDGSGNSRVYKFSADGSRLPSLKREAAVWRVLAGAIDRPAAVARVLGWNFEQLPFFIECEFGGPNLAEWAQIGPGLPGCPLACRIELVARIAEAVAAAHGVGVLHKDLKPANILIVDEPERGPHPRLTDFGAADLDHASHPDRLAALSLSVRGALAGSSDSGTPMYLAPELLRGEMATIQSDIYSLGVLLYQIVIGDLRHPLTPDWEQAVSDELLRDDIRACADSDAGRRLVSARQLAERLRALPERRATLLAERQRAQRVAAAERELDRDRARRPWRRALIGALAAGLALSLWFFRASIAARDEALHQAAIAQAAADVLNDDLVAAANPDLGGSSGATVLAALTGAAARIDQRLRDAPEVAVRLHEAIGTAYRTLGRYAEAEIQFSQAQQLAESRGLARDTRIRSTLLLAQDLAYRNLYDQAQALLDRVDVLLGGATATDASIEIQRWDVRAMLARHRGDLAAAREAADKALAALDAHRDADETLDTQFERLALLHIALAQQEGGARAQAERLERELLERLKRKGAGNRGFALRVRAQLVDNLLGAGRLDEAEAQLPELIEASRTQLGEHSLTWLSLQTTSAAIASARGRHQEAIGRARETAEGYAELLGPGNDLSIRAMLTLGRIEAAAGAHREALADLQHAADAATALQGGQGPFVQLARYELAAAALAAGDSAKANANARSLNPALLHSAAPERDWATLLRALRTPHS